MGHVYNWMEDEITNFAAKDKNRFADKFKMRQKLEKIFEQS